MATLQELLAHRHKELLSALAETRRRIETIQVEISQIEKAASAAGIDLARAREQGETKQIQSYTLQKPMKTIKEAAVEILSEAERGLTANEILEALNHRLGTEYPRSSLSPQLSRLKHGGIVYQEGDRWVLASSN